MIFWYEGRTAENLRVYLRVPYLIFIWYQFLELKTTDVDSMDMQSNVPFWIAAGIIFFYAQIERYCLGGTRLEVMLFSLGWYIHLIAFSLLGAGPGTGKIVANSILILWFLYTFNVWAKYREDNLSNLKLGGRYKVGFKRIDTSCFKDVLMFYPVDADRKEGKVHRHKYADKFLEGNAKAGKAKKGFEYAGIKAREVK